MLRPLSCIAALAAVLPTVQAETIWARGVSEQSGWVDINKAVTPDGKAWANATEGGMCYAAAAANLIVWWQAQYCNIPTGTPNTQEAVWSTYVQYANHGGGQASCALQWWFSGSYNGPVFSPKNTLLNPRQELYYNQEAVNTTLEQFICYKGGTSLVEAANAEGGLSASIVNAFKEGKGLAIGLSGISHTVTLWGVEVDATTQTITKLWLTDSDDIRADLGNYTSPAIFPVDVKTRKARINNQPIVTLQITGNDGNRGFKNAYITALYGIDPAVTNAPIWGLQAR